MADLVLPLKAEYFNAIRSGEKVEEFRLCTEYWTRRLEHRHFDKIVLTLGYPKRGDHARRIIKPWRGFVTRTITHPHFGAEPVRVFAINVGP